MPARTKPSTSVRIALASLRAAPDIETGVARVTETLRTCAAQGVDLVCFPETYLPGLRVPDWHVRLDPPDQRRMRAAMARVRATCAKVGIAAILGVEWVSSRGLENRAVVVARDGRLLGHQTKNQITPGGESESYVPDGRRRLFRVGAMRFGIVICHEGWRYPETARWAAVRGAQVIFQPQATGDDAKGPRAPRRPWGESFYEKAMACRAGENSVFFASVNVAMRRQNSATSLVAPSGELIASLTPGREGVLIRDIDLAHATRRYAKRYRPELYPR